MRRNIRKPATAKVGKRSVVCFCSSADVLAEVGEDGGGLVGRLGKVVAETLGAVV